MVVKYLISGGIGMLMGMGLIFYTSDPIADVMHEQMVWERQKLVDEEYLKTNGGLDQQIYVNEELMRLYWQIDEGHTDLAKFGIVAYMSEQMADLELKSLQVQEREAQGEQVLLPKIKQDLAEHVETIKRYILGSVVN